MQISAGAPSGADVSLEAAQIHDFQRHETEVQGFPLGRNTLAYSSAELPWVYLAPLGPARLQWYMTMVQALVGSGVRAHRRNPPEHVLRVANDPRAFPRRSLHGAGVHAHAVDAHVHRCDADVLHAHHLFHAVLVPGGCVVRMFVNEEPVAFDLHLVEAHAEVEMHSGRLELGLDDRRIPLALRQSLQRGKLRARWRANEEQRLGRDKKLHRSRLHLRLGKIPRLSCCRVRARQVQTPSRLQLHSVLVVLCGCLCHPRLRVHFRDVWPFLGEHAQRAFHGELDADVVWIIKPPVEHQVARVVDDPVVDDSSC